MTTNGYWLFLEELRQSGIVNMWGAAPFLVEEFGITMDEANKILVDWIKNYNQKDYEEN